MSREHSEMKEKPSSIVLMLFQHTFGTHLLRNLYQQAMFRDSFHWLANGGIA